MAATDTAAVPRIGVAIVTFDSASTLGHCLDALFAQKDVELEVVIFDNASRDESAAVAGRRPQVRLVRSERNVGFAAGANAAFRETVAPLVLFLNPDVILEPASLARLARTLDGEPEDVAAVQPKLLLLPPHQGKPARLDSTGIVLGLENLDPVDRGRGETDIGQFDDLVDIFGPTAACALWRREALQALSPEGAPFDESFFAYYEDVDLAWRARRLGRRFRFCSEAQAIHERKNPPFHGDTVDARAFANRYLMLVKNATSRELALTLLRVAMPESVRWLGRTITRPGFREAWRHLARGLGPAWRARRAARPS